MSRNIRGKACSYEEKKYLYFEGEKITINDIVEVEVFVGRETKEVYETYTGRVAEIISPREELFQFKYPRLVLDISKEYNGRKKNISSIDIEKIKKIK